MRKDKKGIELKVGDKVVLELFVKDFMPQPDTKDEVVILSNGSVSLACASDLVEKKY